jgi:hypothetical protein
MPEVEGVDSNNDARRNRDGVRGYEWYSARTRVDERRVVGDSLGEVSKGV